MGRLAAVYVDGREGNANSVFPILFLVVRIVIVIVIVINCAARGMISDVVASRVGGLVIASWIARRNRSWEARGSLGTGANRFGRWS